MPVTWGHTLALYPLLYGPTTISTAPALRSWSCSHPGIRRARPSSPSCSSGCCTSPRMAPCRARRWTTHSEVRACQRYVLRRRPGIVVAVCLPLVVDIAEQCPERTCGWQHIRRWLTVTRRPTERPVGYVVRAQHPCTTRHKGRPALHSKYSAGSKGRASSHCASCTLGARGVAVSHCITWFQTQPIPTTCQIRYHGHCGIIIALDSSEP